MFCTSAKASSVSKCGRLTNLIIKAKGMETTKPKLTTLNVTGETKQAFQTFKLKLQVDLNRTKMTDEEALSFLWLGHASVFEFAQLDSFQ
jgi:hypothetical protein